MKNCSKFIQVFILSALAFATGCKSVRTIKNELLQDRAFLCSVLNLDSNVVHSKKISDKEFSFELIKPIKIEGHDLKIAGIINYQNYTVSLTRPSINVFNTANFSKLEHQYCYRMYPYADDDLLKEDFGFPALELPSKEVILVNSEDKNLLKAMDWDELLLLNENAKALWDESVSHKGAAQTRAMYFKNKLDGVEDLKEQIKIFISSTDFNNTHGNLLIKNIHPLFVQILLEMLGENFITIDLIQIQELAERMESIQVEGYRAIDLVYMNGLYNDKKTAKDLMNAPDFYYKKAVLVLNIINILQGLSENECGQWGLRPELTRIYLQSTFNSRAHVGPLKMKLFNFDNMLVDKNAKACGDLRNIQFIEHKDLKAYGDLYSTQYLILNPETLKVIRKIFKVSQL